MPIPNPNNPFEYTVGPTLEEIRKEASKGFHFISPITPEGKWAEEPLFGIKNTSTRFLRRVQHKLMTGFSTIPSREISGGKIAGVTVGISGDGQSWGSGLELNLSKRFTEFRDVGVSKRALTDYLDRYKEHELFGWARKRTVGYTEWGSLRGNQRAISEWQGIHGQSLDNAVFKLDISAQSRGVWTKGIKTVPSDVLSNPKTLVQPKLNILEEYRVVTAGNKAVDMSYRWGKGGLNKEPGKLAWLWRDIFGVQSGKPELLQPVIEEEAKALRAFSERYSRTMPYKVGAIDVARIGKGTNIDDYMVIEAQKKFGNISLPWVRQKIEHTLTGRWPMEWKVGAGVAATAVGVFALSKMFGRDDKGGSNNKPINKITGHHPGWANKQTEEAIDSDFTAGNSWNGLSIVEKAREGNIIWDKIERISKRSKDEFFGDISGMNIVPKKESPLPSYPDPAISILGAFSKITGHNPGWANKKTEKAIDSDFEAGKSYVGPKAIKKWMRIVSKLADVPALADPQIARKYISSGRAFAKQRAKQMGRGYRTVYHGTYSKEAAKNIMRDGILPGGGGNVSRSLTHMGDTPNMKRTFFSKNMKHPSEYAGEDGVARIFRIRIPNNVKVENNIEFIGSLAEGANKSKRKALSKLFATGEDMSIRGPIPRDWIEGLTVKSATKKKTMLLNRAGKYLKPNIYAKPMNEGGVGIMQIMKMSPKQKEKFYSLLDKDVSLAEKMLSRADKVGRRAQENLSKIVRKSRITQTVGTNQVLHDRRINHTIIDQAEKTKHLFKI